MAIWIAVVKVSLQPAKSGDHKHCGSEDIIFLLLSRDTLSNIGGS